MSELIKQEAEWMAVRGGGVQWSGKNEFWSVKSQGISYQTKSGHPVKNWIIKKISQYIGLG